MITGIIIAIIVIVIVILGPWSGSRTCGVPFPQAIDRTASQLLPICPQVIHISVEMAPIAKVGGMGDVVTALGRAVQVGGWFECLSLFSVASRPATGFRIHHWCITPEFEAVSINDK